MNPHPSAFVQNLISGEQASPSSLSLSLWLFVGELQLTVPSVAIQL